MNPIKLWKIYKRAQKVITLLERGKMNKSLFKSKTFWFNLLTAGAEFAQIIPLPPGTSLIISNITNIGLRLITDKAVTVK